MTYPSGGFTNNWGPGALASSFSYYPPVGSGVPAAAANVAPPSLSPPSSDPSGELITEYYLNNVLLINSAQQGVTVSNVAVKLAGVDPAAVQQNNWYSGSYGMAGNKFS